MRDIIKKLVAVVVIASLISLPVLAQEEVFTDDFEDGDADGWEIVNENRTADVDSRSFRHSWSLFTETTNISGDHDRPIAEWTDGPSLDMNQDFRIEGIMRINWVTNQDHHIRVGLTGDDHTAEGENAYLIFNRNDNSTYLGTWNQASEPEGSIDSNFEDEWIRFVIASDGGDDALRAKVWNASDDEPETFQLEREGFTGVTGLFGVNPGSFDNSHRQIWVDEITIEGTQQTLDFDVPPLMLHGETHEYSVMFNSMDVTENTTVESLNTDGITVDEGNNLLIATPDEDFNQRVEVRAEHNGTVVTKEIAVASVSVENLEVLPGIWRFSAVMDDWTLVVILMAILVGVVATRASTAFGGLGAMELVVLVGWFGGYIPEGIAMVSVFVALFIGFNLSANIDYSVRR